MKKFFLIVLPLLFVLTSHMNAQVSTHGTAAIKESNANTNNLTLNSFNVPIGNDVVLVVGARNADQPATTLTYNSLPLTKLNGITNGIGNSSIWYLPLGNVTSPITADIVMTLSGTSQTKMMVAICFKNVSQSTPLINFASNSFGSAATSSSLTANGASGDMAYDIISSIGSSSTAPTLSIASGQTLIGTAVSTSQPKRRVSSSYKSLTASSTNMDWTISGSTNGAGIHLAAVVKSAGILPVELESWAAQEDGEMVRLSWSTVSEINNESFVIERSSDGNVYSQLGTLLGAGTTLERQRYTFWDESPLKGINYYRLKQIDFNGSTSYSQVVTVLNSDEEGSIRIAPNVVSNGVCNLLIDNKSGGEGLVVIYDIKGQLVQSEKIWISEKGENIIPLEIASLNKGQYVVSIITQNKKSQSRLIVQ